ncbi:hypothetical protein QVD17_16204 [Tagetes erecta]|uniref:Uncharacterized protein n=1 Tax=Tagetes erecta TaxID=13708 RepID=A0AAD8P0B3_TARER|nr:hypothetical protein QVD17_16204 [Tagetes erecta]
MAYRYPSYDTQFLDSSCVGSLWQPRTWKPLQKDGDCKLSGWGFMFIFEKRKQVAILLHGFDHAIFDVVISHLKSYQILKLQHKVRRYPSLCVIPDIKRQKSKFQIISSMTRLSQISYRGLGCCVWVKIITSKVLNVAGIIGRFNFKTRKLGEL